MWNINLYVRDIHTDDSKYLTQCFDTKSHRFILPTKEDVKV